jgi:predicted transcriptional regulator
MTTIDRTILRDAMCDLGLSTYQVATAAGMVQPVVRAIMAGEVRPTMHQAERLCNVLDLDIDEVIKEPVGV